MDKDNKYPAKVEAGKTYGSQAVYLKYKDNYGIIIGNA